MRVDKEDRDLFMTVFLSVFLATVVDTRLAVCSNMVEMDQEGIEMGDTMSK